MKKVRKLSDHQFNSILRANGGIFARTAKAINEKYGVDYSRQAVRERALKRPDILADIYEEFVDDAEGCLHSLLHSDNESISFKTAELILRTKGKDRGFVEKKEHVIKGELTTVSHAEAVLEFALGAAEKGWNPGRIAAALEEWNEIDREPRDKMIAVLKVCERLISASESVPLQLFSGSM